MTATQARNCKSCRRLFVTACAFLCAASGLQSIAFAQSSSEPLRPGIETPSIIEGPRIEIDPSELDPWNVEEFEEEEQEQNDADATDEPETDAAQEPGDEPDQAVEETVDNDIPLPEISTDIEALPFPVKRMRELILQATESGDIEKLRSLIGIGDGATLLSLGGYDGDPIEFLISQSGDDQGHELLAILEEVLQAGYAHMDAGTEQELYVWPYFFAYPLDRLTDRQRVELFRIVTYGDYIDMEDFGGYIFYRVGIEPDGRWQFFVAGD